MSSRENPGENKPSQCQAHASGPYQRAARFATEAPARQAYLATEHLFGFLYDPMVPPTNNASEQALRHSVVHRKLTGGFPSDWSADAHAIVTTVLDTGRKRGEDLLATLHAAFGEPVAVPPGLPILSPGR
jgi:hypothetical protein